MLTKAKQKEYYHAFVSKDSQYDGIFFAGIKTTSIFCRPTCSARKPKKENCVFFITIQEAMLAGYRACKRCHPLSIPGKPSKLIRTLIAAVEEEPERKWKDMDVQQLGFDPSTARRQFKQHYKMTFVAYARARRMGIALKTIHSGDKIINAQIDAAYESGSGFRDAFSKIFGEAPVRAKNKNILKAAWLETPLGGMIAIADDKHLYLLEFTDRRGLEREIENMRKNLNTAILPGSNPVLIKIKEELQEYFSGALKTFQTPVKLNGSEFQQSVLAGLMNIPYGQTRSYKQQAVMLDKCNAVRAVARANGINQLAIVIPCHRVVGSDGKLTGYSGGLARKKWLLDHERKNS